MTSNWADFYSRMGIDASAAPVDPSAVQPTSLPPFATRSPAFTGSIAQYFALRLAQSCVFIPPVPIDLTGGVIGPHPGP